MELSLAPVENNAESLGKPSCSIRGHPLAIRRINTAASGVPIPQLVGSTTSRSLRRCCSMDTDLSQPHQPHLRSLIDSVCPASLKVASTSGVQDGKRRVLPSSFFLQHLLLVALAHSSHSRSCGLSTPFLAILACFEDRSSCSCVS